MRNFDVIANVFCEMFSIITTHFLFCSVSSFHLAVYQHEARLDFMCGCGSLSVFYVKKEGRVREERGEGAEGERTMNCITHFLLNNTHSLPFSLKNR